MPSSLLEDLLCHSVGLRRVNVLRRGYLQREGKTLSHCQEFQATDTALLVGLQAGAVFQTNLKRWRLPSSAEVPTYHVYVIELVGMPGHAPHEKWVYVGHSSKTPAERFDQHKAGGLLASRVVAKYGRRLLPALYRNIGPFADRKTAERAEARLARDLRRRGYVVPGKHGKPVRTRAVK